MNGYLTCMVVLPLFYITVVLKALETMRTLVFGNLLSEHTVFPFFVLEGKAVEGLLKY